MEKTDKHILTKSERVEFLTFIEDKGIETPKDWKLIHSEICKSNEDEIDIDSIVSNLKAEGLKFAIDVVSNPNEPSFLDSGVVKVRYRYVLDPIHAGEEKIKENTREFCSTLIRKNLLYRREDINAMSFRGSNPIAKKRYSIFNSAGGWNCRHAWQREIYVMPQRTKTVENGLKTSTEDVPKVQLSMSNEKKSLKVRFGEFLQKEGRKLTEQEVVDLTSVMLEDKAVEQKFVDIQVEDKTLRIDAEQPEVGAPVSWVDAEGNMMEVEDGSYPVNVDGKEWIIVVVDRKISEMNEVESQESAEEAEQEMSEDKGPTVQEQFESFKKEIPSMIAEAVAANMSEHTEKQTKAFSTIIEAKFKKLPAFPAEEVNAELSAEENKNEKKEGTLLERMVKVAK
jgi:hypothetical protein